MVSFARKMDAAAKAQHVRDCLPEGGLFKGHDWRIAPEPFQLEPNFAKELEALGTVLLQFYKAADLLYRQSVRRQTTDLGLRMARSGQACFID